MTTKPMTYGDFLKVLRNPVFRRVLELVEDRYSLFYVPVKVWVEDAVDRAYAVAPEDRELQAWAVELVRLLEQAQTAILTYLAVGTQVRLSVLRPQYRDTEYLRELASLLAPVR